MMVLLRNNKGASTKQQVVYVIVIVILGTICAVVNYANTATIAATTSTTSWIANTRTSTSSTTSTASKQHHRTNITSMIDGLKNDPLLCQRIVPNWLMELSYHQEHKVFSQYGEDGITELLIHHVPISKKRLYVELGTETGIECNTRILREQHAFTGLLLDGNNENDTINLRKEMIFPQNIVHLLNKYNVSSTHPIDYFSIDTDYAEYFLWKEILEAGYQPTITVTEINSNFQRNESGTVHNHNETHPRIWAHTINDYFGVSALAIRRLWNQHGIIMVYCTEYQINCFGIHRHAMNISEQDANLIQECLWFKPIAFYRKIHKCDNTHEKYLWVHELGQVQKDVEWEPRFLLKCKPPSLPTIS